MHRPALWTVGALLAVALAALVFTLGYVSNGSGDQASGSTQDIDRSSGESNSDAEPDFQTLDEIVDILLDEHFDKEALERDVLYQAAINGLLDSLADTGTFYIDPVSYQVSIGPSGTFEGIGATVNQDQQSGAIVIVSPFPNSPAEQAGIEAGDVIRAVDGESTQGWTVDQAVLRIRGPKGTEVVLTVEHLDGATEDVTIVRDEIQVDSVSTSPPGGALRDADGNEVSDIAYLRILEFNEQTPEEVRQVAAQAEDSGKQGLILDLRLNPGGLLQETVDTADLFLDEGVILIEVDNQDNERRYTAEAGGAALDIPIVVIQDELSASGAEVLSAALKDNDRAIILGETSFGKGTVNTARELSDGGALFVTIRRWLTPDGVQIDGVGIRPDVEVTPGPLDPQYDPANDQQIRSAIDILHGLEASSTR